MRTRSRGCFLLVFLIIFSLSLIWVLLGNEHEKLETVDIDRSLKASVQRSFSSSISPRIIFLVVQTKVSHGWCRMLASAILSNVSVISIGFGGKYAHVKRPLWVLDYIEREGLRDSDVIVSFDGSDTLFSGFLTLHRAVERFMKTTAPSFDVFDPAAIIRGEATAPLLFTAEANCYHPQLAGNVEWGVSKGKCMSSYKRIEQLLESRFPSSNRIHGRLHYLNAGGYVGRVWALKKAATAYRHLLTTRKGWWCDQSAWGLLFLWSISEDMTVADSLRIPLGVIGLDYHNTFFLSLHSMHIGRNIRLRDQSSVSQVMVGSKLHYPSFFEIVGNPNATPVILHFNGLSREAQSTIQSILTHSSWYVEAKQSPVALSWAKEFVRKGMLLETRGMRGEQQKNYHGELCRGDHIF